MQSEKIPEAWQFQPPNSDYAEPQAEFHVENEAVNELRFHAEQQKEQQTARERHERLQVEAVLVWRLY